MGKPEDHYAELRAPSLSNVHRPMAFCLGFSDRSAAWDQAGKNHLKCLLNCYLKDGFATFVLL